MDAVRCVMVLNGLIFITESDQHGQVVKMSAYTYPVNIFQHAANQGEFISLHKSSL